MVSSFHFVDGLGGDDREAKRRMRRHVMKGKNAGKTFNRPSRLALSKHQFTGPRYQLTWPSGRSVRPYLPLHASPHSIKIINDCSSSLLSRRIPSTTHINSSRQVFDYVVDRMFPKLLNLTHEDVNKAWLRILFADELAFKCNLDLMQACNEVFLHYESAAATEESTASPNPTSLSPVILPVTTFNSSTTRRTSATSPIGLHHLTNTLSHVVARLQDQDRDRALSDSTIGIIVSLVSQEMIRDEAAGAAVHLDGLRRVIELRGGLDEGLKRNPQLMLKVCKMDIMHSLQHSIPPMFFHDNMEGVRRDVLAEHGVALEPPPEALAVLAAYDTNNTNDHSHVFGTDDWNLAGLMVPPEDIYLDFMAVSAFYNNHFPRKTLGTMVYMEVIVSFGYRLARWQRQILQDQQHRQVQIHEHSTQRRKRRVSLADAYQAGLSLFVMSMFVSHGPRSVVNYGCLAARVRSALGGCCNPDSGHRSPQSAEAGPAKIELALWLVMISSIWASTEGETAWLADKAGAAARALRLETWGAVKDRLGRFPWIDELHDQKGRDLWDRARGGGDVDVFFLACGGA